MRLREKSPNDKLKKMKEKNKKSKKKTGQNIIAHRSENFY